MSKLTPLSLGDEARELLKQLATNSGMTVTGWVREMVYREAQEQGILICNEDDG